MLFLKHDMFFPMRRAQNTRAFSLIEVLAALLLLSVSVIALSQNQVQSIRLIQTAKFRDQAVRLAQSRMNELDQKVKVQGIDVLKDSERGEFDQELYPTYTWTSTKEKIPVPDFMQLVSMASGESAQEDEFDMSSLQGPMKSITDIWGKAIRQVTVEVSWKENRQTKSYALVTHYVDDNAFGQVQGLIGGFGAAGGSDDDGAQAP